MTHDIRFGPRTSDRPISRRALAAGAAAAGADLALLAGQHGRARAGGVGTPPAEATPGATPAGSSAATPAAMAPAILVRVEYVGGFAPPETMLTAVPTYQLTDDGTEISQGVQVQVFPPPALPSLQAATLTDAGTEAVLDAVRAAGLDVQDQEYINPSAPTDLPNQIITVTLDGKTVTTTLYGLDQLAPGDTSGLADARNRLQPFLTLISTPPSLRASGQVVAPETFYAFDELQIVAVPADELPAAEGQSALEGSTPTEPVTWPLTTALSGFGIPLSDTVGGEGYAGTFPGARVDTVSGEDLAAVLPLAQEASQLTIWESDGEDWVLLLRPLLPGEVGNLARPASGDEQAD